MRSGGCIKSLSSLVTPRYTDLESCNGQSGWTEHRSRRYKERDYGFHYNTR